MRCARLACSKLIRAVCEQTIRCTQALQCVSHPLLWTEIVLSRLIAKACCRSCSCCRCDKLLSEWWVHCLAEQVYIYLVAFIYSPVSLRK